MRGTRVYVVAWEYDGGGGFDWYDDQATALAEYLREKDSAVSGWSVFWFAYIVKDATTPNGVTEEVAREIDAGKWRESV